MKAFYSIQELADILETDIYSVADGLAACGVTPCLDGRRADLSKWARPIIDNGNGALTIMTGFAVHPDPSTVVVSAEALPALWAQNINKSSLLDGENGSGIDTRDDPGKKKIGHTEELIGKGRTTALKVIGGMAIRGYGIDIHAAPLKGIGEIVADLELVGAGVTEKTLRELLKEAAAIIEKKK